MKGLGANSLEEMRKIPAETIIDFVRANHAYLGLINDGYSLTADPSYTMFEGKNHDLDYMLGCNEDEGQAFTPPVKTIDDLRKAAAINFGDKADDLLKAGNITTDAEAEAFFKSSHRLISATHGFAERQEENGKKAPYLYFFTRRVTTSALSTRRSSGLCSRHWNAAGARLPVWTSTSPTRWRIITRTSPKPATRTETVTPNGGHTPRKTPFIWSWASHRG